MQRNQRTLDEIMTMKWESDDRVFHSTNLHVKNTIQFTKKVTNRTTKLMVPVLIDLLFLSDIKTLHCTPHGFC